MARRSPAPKAANSAVRVPLKNEVELGSVTVAVGDRIRGADPALYWAAGLPDSPITGDPDGVDPVTVPETTNSTVPASGSLVSNRTPPNFVPTTLVSSRMVRVPLVPPAMLDGADTRLKPGGSTTFATVSGPLAVLVRVKDCCT